MGDIINLRQERKAKKREDGKSRADANRVTHGRTKADKCLTDMAKQRHDAVMDGARRERKQE